METLPSHSKSKTWIKFIDSPKQWTRHFMYYLKERNPDVHYYISNGLSILMAFLLLVGLTLIGYLIGYAIVDDFTQQKIYDDLGFGGVLIISIFGISAILALILAFHIIKSCIISVQHLSDILIQFASVLKQYVDDKDEVESKFDC